MKKTYNLQLTTSSRGFTLIELLVVVAIIGLLSSIILVALNISRLRARDARRIADMKQVKLGFDLYLNEAGGYPPDTNWITGQSITCTNAFTRVPGDPLSPMYEYTYTSTGAGVVSDCTGNPLRYPGYRIDFYIENKDEAYYMNEDGNVFNSSDQSVAWDSLLN